jgi:predicted metal-binding protein
MSVTDEAALGAIALRCGAFKTAAIDVSDIPFRREFRDACKQNRCGKYGKNWMCPPDVGDIDELMAQAGAFRRAFVLQSVGTLSDSFDVEGMELASRKHRKLLVSFFSEITPTVGHALKLGGGACLVCEKCAKYTDDLCRFPERAIASLEAYGIAVSELADRCGLQYVNGTNTITYFGAVLYD